MSGPSALTAGELMVAERSIRRLMMQRQWSTDRRGWDISPDTGCRRVEDDPPAADEGADSIWAAGPDWRGIGLGTGFRGFRGRLSREQRRVMKSTQPCWMPAMMHFLTNELIEVSSRTRARGRWYAWEPATVRAADGGMRAIWIAGTYDCRFVCVDGEWRFRTITFSEVFSTGADGDWLDEPHVDYGPAHCRHDAESGGERE